MSVKEKKRFKYLEEKRRSPTISQQSNHVIIYRSGSLLS